VTRAAAPATTGDYAAWSKKNPDGSWTALTEKAVAASALPGLVPNDIKRFCPAYPDLSADDRKKFWVGLLSAMARPESNFKPEVSYTEKFNDGRGEPVVSRGLLQLSIESANQKRHGCAIAKAEDLHDSAVNLPCGVKILEAWVKADGVIAYDPEGRNRGGGRYWSVMRTSKKHLAEITGFTGKLAVCREQ
jgi:hypothetical protein